MKKTILISICAIILVLIGLLYLKVYWVILPTGSSSHKLTLVLCDSFTMKRVTLSQYVKGKHTNDYVLKFKADLKEQMPQTYELPKIKEGRIKVTVDMDSGGGEISGDKEMEEDTDNVISWSIYYEKASDLYKNGLLIYKNCFFIEDEIKADSYLHFISGNERISFFNKSRYGYFELQWEPIFNAPPPKGLVRPGNAYAPMFDSNWKEENKWVVIPVK